MKNLQFLTSKIIMILILVILTANYSYSFTDLRTSSKSQSRLTVSSDSTVDKVIPYSRHLIDVRPFSVLLSVKNMNIMQPNFSLGVSCMYTFSIAPLTINDKTWSVFGVYAAAGLGLGTTITNNGFQFMIDAGITLMDGLFSIGFGVIFVSLPTSTWDINYGIVISSGNINIFKNKLQ